MPILELLLPGYVIFGSARSQIWFSGLFIGCTQVRLALEDILAGLGRRGAAIAVAIGRTPRTTRTCLRIEALQHRVAVQPIGRRIRRLSWQ